MLRRFGSLIWRQPREMQVFNYSNHLVYEIATNHKPLYVAYDKTTNTIEVVTDKNKNQKQFPDCLVDDLQNLRGRQRPTSVL